MASPGNLLEQAVKDFISQNEVCTKTDRILVGVSGGIDSMVLANILINLGYQIGIAHFNYKLRKKASDKDEAFISTYTDIWKVPFHRTSLDTKRHVKKHKLNLQEAARNLRYTWFSQIMETYQYDYLATAHHMDDQIETVMLNIARGAGIFGLHGMKPKSNHIIRPLLFAKKEDLRLYAREKHILYREDQSNKESKYRRNFLRNDLIPKIEDRVPAFKKRMHENILIWQKSARLLRGFLDQQITQRKKLKDESIILELDKIEDSLRDLVTFEWLRTYGFNYSQVVQMVRCVEENQSGKEFYSHFNRVIVDRKKLILSSLDQIPNSKISINNPDDLVHLPNGKIEIKLLSAAPMDLNSNENQEYFDARQIKFPLILRKWQAGDYFHPLGMGFRKQKLKKFFANQKMSKLEKEAAWLLCCEKDICWVVGRRIDERYKVSEDTTYTLRITWLPD